MVDSIPSVSKGDPEKIEIQFPTIKVSQGIPAILLKAFTVGRRPVGPVPGLPEHVVATIHRSFLSPFASA